MRTHCRRGHDLSVVGVYSDGRCAECRRLQAKARRAADPERYRATDRARLDARLAQRRARRKADPETVRQQDREQYVRSRDNKLAIKRRQYERERAEVIAAYGGACVVCGKTEGLDLDHVNNDGKQHRAEVGAGWSFYRWLKQNDFPNDPPLQLLCERCHVAKHGAFTNRLRVPS
jgi:hypothetical protein